MNGRQLVQEPCWRCGHDWVTVEEVNEHWDEIGVRFHCANPLCDNVSSVRRQSQAHMRWNRSSLQQRTRLGDRFGRTVGPRGERSRPKPDSQVEEEFLVWYRASFGRRPNLRVGSADNRVFFAWVAGRVLERQASGEVMNDRLKKTLEVLWGVRKP